jgi:hypothetical protein
MSDFWIVLMDSLLRKKLEEKKEKQEAIDSCFV